jgi:NAD(P)-dependent dehydrogenase (short-subunit alcohol dehydrogenase family)
VTAISQHGFEPLLSPRFASGTLRLRHSVRVHDQHIAGFQRQSFGSSPTEYRRQFLYYKQREGHSGLVDNLRPFRSRIRAMAHRTDKCLCVKTHFTATTTYARQFLIVFELHLPVVGLLNNAGIMQMRRAKNAPGWDRSFVTNHLGPFAPQEALLPSLPSGANVPFVVSAREDPERKPAVGAGFRGGRYISAEAHARGEWKPGGAKEPGYDAYATSKQAILAALNAIEPGLNPAETRALLSTIPGQYGVDKKLAIIARPASRSRAERRTP